MTLRLERFEQDAHPAFRRDRERQHKRAARRRAAPPKLKPPARRDAEDNRGAGAARPATRPQPEWPPAPPGRQQTIAEQTPAINAEQAERDAPTMAAEEPDEAAYPPRSPSTSPHDGVPIFPDTPDGRAARLAYYEARKLTNLPNSLYDYNDAKRGDEPRAERRARERRDNRRPR